MSSSIENILGKTIRLYLGDYILKKVAEKRDDWFFSNYINKYLTVFCLDIIELNEKVSDLKPEDLLNSLVLYHQTLAKYIIENNGFIQTISESSLICLFGLENEETHAFDACKAALFCKKGISSYNQTIKDKYNIPNYANIGIGIASGLVSVGNIGSQYRLKFAAIGNTVNLASQLTPLNKKYKTTILISKETNDLIKNNFITRRESDYINKRNNKFTIYQLCDIKDL